MLNFGKCLPFFLLLLPSMLFAQLINREPVSETQKQLPLIPDEFNAPAPDFRIISSDNSYIEIEFTPRFYPQSFIHYKNEQFSVLSFVDAVSPGEGSEGKPDLKYRCFPVIFPSADNNTVTITDIEFSELTGINLAPVPRMVFKEPFIIDNMNSELVYDKNINVYSTSSYLPENPVSINNISPLRDILLGYLVINPIQYNPVSKSVKQIKRIRVRINFGNQPVHINRKRSFNEFSLLKDIAVNSGIAVNWMNPALLKQTDKRIENSVMNTGDWYRIEIKDNGTGGSEGIYKITKSFLEGAGINLSNVDPRTIKMYGNGGEMLPFAMNKPRINDLEQIAVHIEGEIDGKFDPNDYILFYGKSVNNFIYDSLGNIKGHYISAYSVSNYYWICLNTPQNGKRMDKTSSENQPNPYRPTSFKEKLFFEPEINNLLNEGNLWFSERKSPGQSFMWNNTLTGLDDNSMIYYRVKGASRSLCTHMSGMEIKEVNSVMSPFNLNLSCVEGGWGNWVFTATAEFSINRSELTSGEQSSIRANYYSSSPDAEGYIDWMEIQYDRKFTSVTQNFMKFISRPVPGITEYDLSPFSGSNVRIYEVSSHDNVKIMAPLEYTGGRVKFQRLELPNIINKYFVVGDNAYKTPASISQKISNQNLHGGFQEGADFIIITHKDFLSAALRIKEKREAGGITNPSYLKTIIVDVQQIYNEYSGGILDPAAIRDFIKYCYDKWTLKPSYVLLLGDGDFDYKNILVNNGNRVPPIEYTDPNLNQITSYTTDDFFADVIEDEKGKPDLAIGRITVETIEEANSYLEKLDSYGEQQYNGYWKNRIVYVADDGKTTNGNDGNVHTQQCEVLAEQHSPRVYDKNKLYLVTYPTVITSQGRRKPGVNKDIISNWNAGCIALNFTGHGSPEVWTHEVVFEKDVAISQLNNYRKYPIVTIASCDFSKFDNPLSISGGEVLAMAPKKGAIGTFAATRPVDGGSNFYLNNTFWDRLLYRQDTLLLQNRFGKVSFEAKNIVNYDLSHRKFVLITDPSQRFQGPRFRSRVDSIAGLVNDTMRALSKIKIFGSIMNPDSSLWHDFNGKITLKIFDVEREVKIKDEDGWEFVFQLPGGIIHSGSQNILKGKWVMEFIVPKDISFRNSEGKLINYFFNNTADGHGMDMSFYIGGINPLAEADTIGPDIKLYINNRNFRDGDVTIENFKLIADLYDESGINTTGTIGHQITGILDNNENSKYDLTPFYNSDSTYKSGSLEYSFTSVAEGEHIIKVKAWDTYNNSSEAQLHFKIASNSTLKLMNVFNFPNPFKDNTAFTFHHNYPSAVNVNIKIYTVAGRLISEIVKKDIMDKFVVIDWTGTDTDGEKLANGVYIYKISLSGEGGETQIETGKLAILK